MIVVTGATGNVGQPLVAALVAAGEQVTAVSRRVVDVPGARVHQADLAIPESLTPALDTAKVVFLLTSGDFMGAGGDLAAVLSVVRSSGVERVVLLSSQGVGTGHHPPVLEDVVRTSGLPWTMLRPGGFHSNTLRWAESVRGRREVAAPFGDVALPTIDPADIAAVAEMTLRDPAHVGKTYELTGPAPISPRAQTEAIAAAVGEPVRFVEQTREEAKATMLRYMPEPIAESTLALLSSPELERVSPVVEQLLGRPARPFADWAKENAAAFK
ncbi:MAG: NAD(P)H-binding protein [Actinophytocola sp.]|uniref:NAD(P)H-binding protein n=1 Tax=Actinophytocola sp. TaxID=1872138 RepID=UPI003C75FEA8